MLQTKRPVMPLHKNTFTHFLPWLVGFMVYMGILILSLSFIAQNIGDKWTKGITKNLNVQILYNETQSDNERANILDRATIMIAQTEGVKYARALSRQELNSLLAPWLGNGLENTNLPIPDMIDVKIADGVNVNIEQLEENLSQVTTNIIVDSHQTWRQKVDMIVSSISNTIAVLTALVFSCAIFMIIASTRGLMSMNNMTIHILIIMGATDNFISKDFCRHAFFLGLKGGVSGFLASLGTVFALWSIAQQTGSPFSFGQYLILSSFIPVTILISTISAYVTVKITLKNRFKGIE